MATSRQTIIEIKVPPKAVGTVIGRQGAMIKEVRVTKKMATSRQTITEIKVPPKPPLPPF